MLTNLIELHMQFLVNTVSLLQTRAEICKENCYIDSVMSCMKFDKSIKQTYEEYLTIFTDRKPETNLILNSYNN